MGPPDHLQVKVDQIHYLVMPSSRRTTSGDMPPPGDPMGPPPGDMGPGPDGPMGPPGPPQVIWLKCNHMDDAAAHVLKIQTGNPGAR